MQVRQTEAGLFLKFYHEHLFRNYSESEPASKEEKNEVLLLAYLQSSLMRKSEVAATNPVLMGRALGYKTEKQYNLKRHSKEIKNTLYSLYDLGYVADVTDGLSNSFISDDKIDFSLKGLLMVELNDVDCGFTKIYLDDYFKILDYSLEHNVCAYNLLYIYAFISYNINRNGKYCALKYNQILVKSNLALSVDAIGKAVRILEELDLVRHYTYHRTWDTNGAPVKLHTLFLFGGDDYEKRLNEAISEYRCWLMNHDCDGEEELY